MKTVRLEGAALDMATELTHFIGESQKRLKQLDDDRAALEAVIQKEMSHKMAAILELVGVDPHKNNGSVDTTYLKDHGLAFVQYQERQSLTSLLESVVAGAVAQPQDSVQ